tara:strand:- start:595 stop:1341 length:747 start_codon:yes stop_codon:yes gene_type:complete
MKNEVELIGVYGGDITHAQSAWTSTYRELTSEKFARMDKLIDKLIMEGHHTPFEKSMLHFIARTDIATHIHILKHRIGVSVNGESARYKELGNREGDEGDKALDRFYVPSDWPEDLRVELAQHARDCYDKYHAAIDCMVKKGIKRKRAKESARFFLPYAVQLRIDLSFNFRSFMHFMILRDSKHAQKEVRWLAQECRRLLEESSTDFKLTFAAFDKMLEAEKIKNKLFKAYMSSGKSVEDILNSIKEV